MHHRTTLFSDSFTLTVSSRGGYSTLVWVGVCRWDFWNATHPCTHFEGKVTHPCTKNQNFSLKFAPFWRKFRKILKSWPIKVPNLRHFGANFRKFWKIDPSKYHVFEKKKKDPLMYLAAWFCYPCLRHIPITTFVLSTPPGVSSTKKLRTSPIITSISIKCISCTIHWIHFLSLLFLCLSCQQQHRQELVSCLLGRTHLYQLF